MRTALMMAFGLVLAVLLVVSLSGCESPEAQRLSAEARLVNAEVARERARAEAEALRIRAEAEAKAAAERAKAEADAERQRARAEAEASMAATRQMERDAAHQRWMETLTTLGLVLLPLSLVAAVAAMLLARQWRTADPALLVYLDRLQRRQMDARRAERELWHALVTMQRRGLPAGRQEVIIYRDEGR
jgi:hypothetical protein